MLDHKTGPNKFLKIEIIQSIISNHNGIKQEISNRKTGKFTSMCKLKETLLTDRSKKKSQGKLENTCRGERKKNTQTFGMD